MRAAVFLLLLISRFTCAFSQDMDSLLAIQHASDPQEKMFVHFDRNYYNPGETIWFKAYLFQGLDRSKDSRNLYAELRDEKGALLDLKTAPVLLSGASSHFQLPDSFPKSTVYFRAYTPNILNGDTSFMYVKAIRILQPVKKTTARPVPAAPDIRFLPESGDLVEGLQNNVAFITTGANEVPASCKGVIKDNTGKQVAEFVSLHDGMGNFSLQPQQGQTFTAVWKDAKGKEYTTPLPVVKQQGIVLQVTEGEGAKIFSLQRRPDAPAELQMLTVLAVQNQQMVYQANINLSSKTSVKTQIPTAELPSGIMMITVFDRDKKAVAERICFVNNSNYEFDADAWLSEINPTKHGLNRGEVKISDTTTANVSVSITDADLDETENDHDNIVTRLLLTGDLRGKIYNPYYYFFSTSDSVGYHLDLVMLTHGWRRYNWDNVMAGKAPNPKYHETDYLAMTGKLIGSQSGAFAQGLSLNGFFRTGDSSSTFISLPVDRTGIVSSEGYIFYDTARLYLQYSDKNRSFEPSMLSIGNGLMERSLLPPPPANLSRFIPFDPDTSTASINQKNNVVQLKMAAKRMKDAQMLENVTVTAKAKTDLEKKEKMYVSGLFTGDGKGFDVVNDRSAVSSMNVFQYLQGKVAGLQVISSGANTQLSWRGGTPSVYLNEMQSDISQVANINMADVGYIKVLSPGSAGAIANSGSGVISVYMRKGGDVVSSPEDSKLGVVRLRGYSPVKEFYLPDYATAGNEGFYDDLRVTLYWNPFIVMDKSKKRFRFQFYNNDITTRFRLVMEGINSDGKLVHVEKVLSKN